MAEGYVLRLGASPSKELSARPVLQRLKNIYRKIEGAASMSGRLRSHDQQLAELHAAVAVLAVEGHGLDATEKEAARVKLEGYLAYRSDAKEEIERLAALYESSAARVAAAEIEIADLRKKLLAIEGAPVSRSKGR